MSGKSPEQKTGVLKARDTLQIKADVPASMDTPMIQMTWGRKWGDNIKDLVMDFKSCQGNVRLGSKFPAGWKKEMFGDDYVIPVFRLYVIVYDKNAAGAMPLMLARTGWITTNYTVKELNNAGSATGLPFEGSFERFGTVRFDDKDKIYMFMEVFPTPNKDSVGMYPIVLDNLRMNVDFVKWVGKGGGLSGLQVGLIVGGVLLGIILIGGLVWWLFNRRVKATAGSSAASSK